MAKSPRTRKLTAAAKIRVVIDGVTFQTTAKLLREGTLSRVLYDAFRQFEAARLADGIDGQFGAYWDAHLCRNVNLQFDITEFSRNRLHLTP